MVARAQGRFIRQRHVQFRNTAPFVEEGRKRSHCDSAHASFGVGEARQSCGEWELGDSETSLAQGSKYMHRDL